MILHIPEIQDVIERSLEIESTIKDKTKPITEWIDIHQKEVQENQLLLLDQSDKGIAEVLRIFLPRLFARSMRGEQIDLLAEKFIVPLLINIKHAPIEQFDVLFKSNYRWGIDIGRKILSDVIDVFKKRDWDIQSYFEDAEEDCKHNFNDDQLLKVNNIGMKVRDLALSCFSPNFVAFDTHIPLVATRIGLLNYGFDLFPSNHGIIEMGSNPNDKKQYLFLNKLFQKLSEKTEDEYSLSDLDRIFWHLGRTYCKKTPICPDCNLRGICLTGRS
ncbi:hypothetical protein ACFLQV_01465 [Calditrichota bacterium]